MTVTELIERAKKLHLDEAYEAGCENDHICARCGEDVYVPEGYDFDHGEWCWECWVTTGKESRTLLPLMARLLEVYERYAEYNSFSPHNYATMRKELDDILEKANAE